MARRSLAILSASLLAGSAIVLHSMMRADQDVCDRGDFDDGPTDPKTTKIPGGTPMYEHDDSLNDAPEATPRSSRFSRLRGTAAGKSVFTLVTLAAVGSIGIFATNAALSDEVTMATIEVTGGTLDLTANGGDGTGEAWSGTLSAAITGMAPGKSQSGTVLIKNNGTLPFTLVGSTTGTDASGCFAYWFRPTGGTPAGVAGMGTADTDGGTAAFATAVTNAVVPYDATDNEWQSTEELGYTMTVRMKSTCTASGANGTLDLTFDAAQV